MKKISLLLFTLIFIKLTAQTYPNIPVIGINGSGRDTINCSNDNGSDFVLTAEDYLPGLRSTESYTLTTETYAPEIDFSAVTSGTKLSIAENEFYTQDIPFDFSFYGETYNSVSVAEDGYVSLLDRQGTDLLFPSASIPNTNTGLIYSVFASHMNLDLSNSTASDAGVYFEVVGTEPFRKAVVTYNKVKESSSNNEVSVQVVLEELTNKIVVYIKNVASGNEKVIGIMGKANGVDAVAVPDGNFTTTAISSKAYGFVPNGAEEPEVNWYEGNYTYLGSNSLYAGNTTTTSVPNADIISNTYTLEVKYPFYKDEFGFDKDRILYKTLTYGETYPVAENAIDIVCTDVVDLNTYTGASTTDTSDDNLTAEGHPAHLFDFEFYEDASLATLITTPSAYTLVGEKEIYVKIINKDDTSCYDVAKLSLSGTYITGSDVSIDYCDDVYEGNPQGSEPFNSDKFIAAFLEGNSADFTFDITTDAAGNNPITEGADLVNGDILYVEFTSQEGTERCNSGIIRVTLNFTTPPSAAYNDVISFPAQCNNNLDGSESIAGGGTWADFLLPKYFPGESITVLKSRYTVKVYTSEVYAIRGTNLGAIQGPYMLKNSSFYDEATNSYTGKYYVRLEEKQTTTDDTCNPFRVIAQDVEVQFYGVKLNPASKVICVEGSSVISMDIACVFEEMLEKYYDKTNNAKHEDLKDFLQESGAKIRFTDQGNSTEYTYSDLYDTSGNLLGTTYDVNYDSGTSSGDKYRKRYNVEFVLCGDCGVNGDECRSGAILTLNIVDVGIDPNIKISVCKNERGEYVSSNIAEFNEEILGDKNPAYYTLTYYTEDPTAGGVSPISSHTFTEEETYLWVKIESNGSTSAAECLLSGGTASCSEVHEVLFKLEGDGTTQINNIGEQSFQVCDNIEAAIGSIPENKENEEYFDITQFESEIYSDPANFTYYKNFDATTYILSDPITEAEAQSYLFTADASTHLAKVTFYVEVEKTTSTLGCSEVLELPIELEFLPALALQNVSMCSCVGLDEYGNFIYQPFDLTEEGALTEMTENITDYSMSELEFEYYEKYTDALILDDTERLRRELTRQTITIQDPSDPTQTIDVPMDITQYSPNSANQVIYVRVSVKDSDVICSKIAEIQLSTYSQALYNDLSNYKVCDLNANGKYEMFLKDLNQEILDESEDIEKYRFSYFTSEDDAYTNTDLSLSILGTYTDEETPAADTYYEFASTPTDLYVRIDKDVSDCASSVGESGNRCVSVAKVNFKPSQVETLYYTNNPPFTIKIKEDNIDSSNNKIYPQDTENYNDGIVQNIDFTTEIKAEIDNWYAGLSTAEWQNVYPGAQSQPIPETYTVYEKLEDLQAETSVIGANKLFEYDASNANFSNVNASGDKLEALYVLINAKAIQGTNEQELCPIVLKIPLEILPMPSFYPGNYAGCTGGTYNIVPYNTQNTATIVQEAPSDYSFTWQDDSGNVVSTSYIFEGAEAGKNYQLQVQYKDNAYPASHIMSFEVEEITAPQIEELIVTGEDKIEVIASGVSAKNALGELQAIPILYKIEKLSGGTTTFNQYGEWLEQNIFEGLKGQDQSIKYNVSVKYDLNTFYQFLDLAEVPSDFEYVNDVACVNSKQALLLTIHNVVTNNNDASNNYFSIPYLDVFEGEKASIQVFNRYGKEVYTSESATEIRWNGESNGKKLPSTSYWYILKLPDGRKKTGSIIVKDK